MATDEPRDVLVVAHSAVLASYRERWEALGRRGHRVRILTPRVWTETNRPVAFEAAASASSIECIPSQPWGDRWPSPRLRNVAHVQPGLPAALRARPPDVLEVFEEPYSLAAWVALRAAARLAPATATLVFSAQNRRKRYPWPFRAFERDVLARADCLLPVDPLVLPVLRAKGRTGPCRVIPLGVDLDRFRPVEPGVGDLPPACREVPRIGFFGKLQPEKGILDLVDALGRMRTPAHLVCVGSGPLETRLRVAGSRVHLLGPVPQARLPALYAAMDIVAVPSRTTPWWMEQFGRVAVEAMACGRPVAVSDSGSLPGVVGDGARVVPEGDPGAWAAALEDLLRPEVAAALSARARRRVAARFTWDAIADLHEDAWRVARENHTPGGVVSG